MCAAAVNNAAFLKDCSDALSVPKNTEFSTSEDSSMSLVWICTGTSDLTKVSVTYTVYMYMLCMYMYCMIARAGVKTFYKEFDCVSMWLNGVYILILLFIAIYKFTCIKNSKENVFITWLIFKCIPPTKLCLILMLESNSHSYMYVHN